MHLADDDRFQQCFIATGTNPANMVIRWNCSCSVADGVTRLVTKGTVVDDIDFDSGIADVRRVEIFFRP